MFQELFFCPFPSLKIRKYHNVSFQGTRVPLPVYFLFTAGTSFESFFRLISLWSDTSNCFLKTQHLLDVHLCFLKFIYLHQCLFFPITTSCLSNQQTFNFYTILILLLESRFSFLSRHFNVHKTCYGIHK